MKIKQERIHSTDEVLARIKQALQKRSGLSLARLASGEAMVLAHNKIIPLSRIPWWVEYAGVKLPNEQARRLLLTAIATADIVGLSTDYAHWESAPLLDLALTAYRVKPKYITSSTINWHLHEQDRLYKVLGQEPTVLVGRLAKAALPRLRRKGVNLIYAEDLEGLEDLPRAENALLTRPYFRVALVAAGIPATILCPRLARKLRCVAIDYGHVINDLVQPGFTVNDLDRIKRDWRQRKKQPLSE
ncbi:MAG TPA: GT-D fold domain-containing glycosyltransferase [Bacillota bacterium]